MAGRKYEVAGLCRSQDTRSNFHCATSHGIFSTPGFLTGTLSGFVFFIGNGFGFVAISGFAKVSKVMCNNKGIEKGLVGFGLSFSCFYRNPVFLYAGGPGADLLPEQSGRMMHLFGNPSSNTEHSKDVTWTNTSSSHPGAGRSAWDDEKTSLARLVDELCQRDLCTWSAVDLIPRAEQLLSKGLRYAGCGRDR